MTHLITISLKNGEYTSHAQKSQITKFKEVWREWTDCTNHLEKTLINDTKNRIENMTNITITVNGQVNSGKTTICHLIKDSLQNSGFKHVVVKDEDYYNISETALDKRASDIITAGNTNITLQTEQAPRAKDIDVTL